jgi:hypothetical protein
VVWITLDDAESVEGSIREKAKFPMIRGPDGSVQRNAFSRYFIRLHKSPNEEALVDEKHLRRDRKVFTKLHLRAFLKKSLSREAWNGAPWLVNEHLAIQYRLPMEIPHHLLREAHLLHKVYIPPLSLFLNILLTMNPTDRHPTIYASQKISQQDVFGIMASHIC